MNARNEASIESNGVTVFGGFEGASLDAVSLLEPGLFQIDCLREPDLPPNGFRVFYDYSFCCGVRNETDSPRSVEIHLQLCERSGKRNIHFMRGPHWVKEGSSWRLLPPSAHRSGKDWVRTRLELPARMEIRLSTKPYWTEDETETALSEYAERLPFVRYRSIGKTAENRKIWAIETEERAETILLSSSLQSAEFAGSVILFWLDWLSMNDAHSLDLLKQYQFVLVPETMPDGVAHGYSIRNALGECPMFHYPEAFAGQEAAAETQALVNLLNDKRPVLWTEVHIHPGDYNTPKLAWIESEAYPDAETAQRAQRVREAILEIALEWRPVTYPMHDRPDFSGRHTGIFNAAQRLGTVGLVLQSYALTEEGKKAMFARFLDTALKAL